MDTHGYMRVVGLFFQARKDWEVGLTTVGDVFFFPFLLKILDCETLLETLEMLLASQLFSDLQFCVFNICGSPLALFSNGFPRYESV